MITDEEIEHHEGLIYFESQDRFDSIRNMVKALADQAREANKLRSDLATAQQLASLLGNQLAEAMKVVEAAEHMAFDGLYAASLGQLRGVVSYWRAWLASHPHVTYGGTMTVSDGALVGGEGK